MMKIAIFLAIILLIIISSCAPRNTRIYTEEYRIAGFWKGAWHGFIAVITFIISLFNHNVGVYEVHNTGWAYNLGFLLGIGAFGGSSNSVCRKTIGRRG